MRFPNADVLTNAAEITLQGAGSQLSNGTTDALSNLQTIAPAGVLSLRNGRNYARAAGASFTNNGEISLAQSTTVTLGVGYTQSATGKFRTQVAGPGAGTGYGQLSATTVNLAGTVIAETGTGPPVFTDVYDIVLGAVTGTFATETLGEEYRIEYRMDRVPASRRCLPRDGDQQRPGRRGASQTTRRPRSGSRRTGRAAASSARSTAAHSLPARRH